MLKQSGMFRIEGLMVMAISKQSNKKDVAMRFYLQASLICVAVFCATCVVALMPTPSKADHLTRKQCYTYFTCILGTEGTLNRCYDNEYLKKHAPTRTICMKYAQHECKVKAGIQGTGRKMTISRPIDKYHRPQLLDHEAGIKALVAEDIRIYNYAGWNHCPPQYQGLQDFWCDPEQLRYPPRPWCDVIPTYNVIEPE